MGNGKLKDFNFIYIAKYLHITLIIGTFKRHFKYLPISPFHNRCLETVCCITNSLPLPENGIYVSTE